MQPLQPSTSPQPDPLFVTPRDSGGAPRPARPATPAAPFRETPSRRSEPMRLVPSIQMYHRMRPGKLYPLTVELRTERDMSHGATSEGALLPGGPIVSVQPVIPGAVVSPASMDVPAITGGQASFWVCPAGRRGMRHKDARVEFRSGGRLLLTVRTPARTITRRLAWLFILLGIALPCLFALIRAFPFDYASGGYIVPRGGQAARPGGEPAAPSPAAGTDNTEKKDTPPAPADKTEKKETPAASTEKKEPGKDEEKKPSTPSKNSDQPTPPSPARPASGQPGGGQPGGERRGPGRGAVGGFRVDVDPTVTAAVRRPLDARGRFDRYLTLAAGYVYGTDEQKGYLAPSSVQDPPKDLREAMYRGVYRVKDGWKITETKRIPGLLDAYECIFERTLWDYQDWVIAVLLLVLGVLLMFVQSASSRRVQGGVLEILPA